MSVEADIFFYMIISCDTCAIRHVGCNDCILTYFITKKEPQEALHEIPDSTADAIDLLSSRGLVRPLRFNSA